MKVLVADDDLPSQMLLSAALKHLGHQVVTASDGESAWATLQAEHFDVLVSDWMMPGLEGPEVTRRLRQQRSGAERYTYVILLTVLSGKSRYLEGIEAGADDFLTKPLDPDLLRARLKVAERILGLREEVRCLEGLLPICSYCKKMREEGEGGTRWVAFESYISERTDASFSHGICPECYAKQVQPELEKLRRTRG